MTKIVIVSGFQPISNPRAVKEAETLAKQGYDIVFLGAIYDENSKQLINSLNADNTWLHIPVSDLTERNALVRASNILYRVKGKFSRLLYSFFGIQLPSQLGSFAGPLYRLAKKQNADLYIVHLEPALWVGKKLIQNGYKVATDIEDWYSEDLLTVDRATRPIRFIKKLEQYLLENSTYTSTTSKVMAQALAKEYSAPEPIVLLNSFRYSERAFLDGKILDRKNTEIPSLIWFSQTVGPGRGIELLFEALNWVNIPIEIHIRGRLRNEGFYQQLRGLIPKTHLPNVHFHELVSQRELLSRLAEHDIGFCGELSSCKSRDLTITNKILEYVRAGLHVVASNTQGQLELAHVKGARISYFDQNSSSELASVLSKIAKTISLKSLKEKIFLDPNDLSELGWEHNSQIFVSNVKAALRETSSFQ